MREWLRVIVANNYEWREFNLIPTAAAYIHKHMPNNTESPWHFHLYLSWLYWYVEFQVGKDSVEA
jgi:hypothetical protein